MKISRFGKYFFIVAISICILAVLGYILRKQDQLDVRSKQAVEALQDQKEYIETTERFAAGLPHQAYSLERLVYEPSSNMLYLPELKIRLPYNPKTKSFLYTTRIDVDGSDLQEADVITDKFVPPTESTTLGCENFIRLKVEKKQNPYNPAEKAYTYKLQDGRKLQVYIFSGDLEGDDECKTFYEQQGVAPNDFVDVFKEVQSY